MPLSAARSTPRAALLACAAFAVTTAALAQEPTKDECIAANEEAQSLQRSGHLRGARDRLRLCTSHACPGAVREDCAARIHDVEEALPSVVLAARDAAGADLVEVRVTLDGEPLASTLDGKAIDVDPGEHAFGFVAPDGARVDERVVVREGERRRVVEARFASPPAATTATALGPTGPAQAPAPPPPADHASAPGRSQRILAIVAGGLGVAALGVGTYFGLHAKSTYDGALAHCPGGTSSCDGQGTQAGRSAYDQATAATALFVGGGLLAAVGVLLYATAPSRDVAVRASLAGVSIGGRW